MWTFTPIGFFSTVALPGDPATVMIRTRQREHLQALIAHAQRVIPGAAWRDDDILKQPSSDYLYRVLKPKDQMVAVFADLLHGIDYSNFKSEASASRNLRRQGAAAQTRYVNALHDIWSVMYDTQVQTSSVWTGKLDSCPHGDHWSPVCFDCEGE